jgi:hypothetical protein
MAAAAGTTPPARPTTLRDLDRQVRTWPNRHRHHGRARRGREAERQCHTKSNFLHHRLDPYLHVARPVVADSKQPAGAKLPIRHDKDNDRLRIFPFMLLNGPFSLIAGTTNEQREATRDG